MKNNKGFTMVELLTVLVVLAVITAITVPVVTSVLRNSRESSYERQLENVIEAAESYGAKNIGNLPRPGNSDTITLRTLKDEGFLEESFINPDTKKEFSDSMEIIISNDNGDITYTINESTISDEE